MERNVNEKLLNNDPAAATLLRLIDAHHKELNLSNSHISHNFPLYVDENDERIRGLAGSGKTIVLAMKAAQLHLQDPDAQILYTFHTKSLYAFIKSLISKFYRHFSNKDANWDKVHILHS